MKTARIGSICLILALASCATPSRDVAAVNEPFKATDAALHFRNEEALKAKLAAIRAARTQIDMAYYIMESDPSSALVAQELLKAADERNVRIRLIVDYFQSQRELPILRLLATHRLVQVRRFGAPSDGFLAAIEDAGIDPKEFIPALTALDTGRLALILNRSHAFQDAAVLRGMLAAQRRDQFSFQELLSELTTYAMEHRSLLRFAAGFRDFLRWNHFKLLLADQRCFVMGGRNLSDQYHSSMGDLLLRDRAYAFQDLDVSGCENGQQQLASFETVWEAGSSVPLEAKVFETSPQPALARAELDRRAAKAGHLFRSSARSRSYLWQEPLEGRLVYNKSPIQNPNNSRITNAYVDHIAALSTGDRLDLYNAYFFLSPSWETHEGGGPRRTEALRKLRDTIIEASRNGVDVRIYTNSKESTDLNIVNVISYPTYRELREAGIRLFELDPGQGSLHMKGAAFGANGLAVGSYNLDPRSHLYDTNNVLFIDDASGEAVNALRAHAESLRWTELREEGLQRIDSFIREPAVETRIKRLMLVRELI
jgi:phosphatidylserine/phosphatidylglycerophosphate/cardiolipin synthase-like enzyme